MKIAVAFILSCILPAYKAGSLVLKAKEVRNSSSHTDDVCVTEECIHTASRVLSKVKLEVNPCDDFYEFACGKFIDNAIIPGNQGSVKTMSVTMDKMKEQLKQLIKAEPSATDPKHYRLANILYKACMNTSQIESLGTTPVVKMVEALGGWPLLLEESWDSNNTWSWENQTAKSSRMGMRVNAILAFGIQIDLNNKSRNIITIKPPSLGLERKHLIKGLPEKRVTAYYDYIVDIAVLFGANKTRAQEELLEALEFGIALAKISFPAEDHRKLHNKYLHTIRQLQQKYPYVQWLTFINSLLPQGMVITKDELLYLSMPSFFDKLGALLLKTPKRVIANYMMWHIHLDSVTYLTNNYRNRELQYKILQNGVQEPKPRWEECADTVIEKLSKSVNSLYVQKYFSKESKAIASQMVRDIKMAFEDLFNNVTWLDKTTKGAAKQKLHKMYAHVAYPDELRDNKELANYYAKLDINENEYFASILKINGLEIDNEYIKLHQPVNKTDWKDQANVAEVEAFHVKDANSIVIPAGIIQGNFFNAYRPFNMNYGALGYAIGHELAHGFDNNCRKYDHNGKLHDWWDKKSDKEFLKRAQCIIDQYGRFKDSLTGLNLNGTQTLGENIADNGGVKIAYAAYNGWMTRNGKEPSLPGLNYTDQQMFWIAFAQTCCEKNTKKPLETFIKTDLHAPGQFRALGTLRNMKDFAKDFQCPPGSPMNPVHKCEVW